MSYLSDKTGRPKEEDGHKRINISVDKFTKDALEKVKEKDGNASRFIEKELKTVFSLHPDFRRIYRPELSITEQLLEDYMAARRLLGDCTGAGRKQAEEIERLNDIFLDWINKAASSSPEDRAKNRPLRKAFLDAYCKSDVWQRPKTEISEDTLEKNAWLCYPYGSIKKQSKERLMILARARAAHLETTLEALRRAHV